MAAWRKIAAAALMMALATPLLSGLPGCSLSSTDAGPTGIPPRTSLPDLHKVGLEQKWQYHIKLRDGERIENAWRVGKGLYVATNQTRVLRIDSLTGTLNFAQELSTQRIPIFRPAEFRLDPSLPNRDVLITTRSQAFVLDKRNGDLQRACDLPVSSSCSPVVAGSTLVIGGANGFQASLRGLFLDNNIGGQRWIINTESTDLFLSTPAVVDSSVIIASKSGHIMRIGGNDGDWIWKDRKTNGEVRAGLAADGRAVYVPCMDKKLYAFNVDTGSEFWQTTLDGILDKTPAMAGSVVLVPSTTRGLYAVTRKDGTNRWFIEGVTSLITPSGNVMWAGDDSGNLIAIKFETGEVVSKTHIDDVQIFVRNPDDDQVTLVAHSGAVAAYVPVSKEE